MIQLTRAILFALISLALPITMTAQNPKNAMKNTRYLALGDSVTFGYNPTVPISLDNYHGYPEFVSDSIHLNVANASCIGETSASFQDASAPDLGCHQWKDAGAPLHVPYTGTQMNYAVAYLRTNPNVKLVTINIGGNDLGLLRLSCASDLLCQISGLPAVYAAYARNVLSIFSRLRGEGGYRGPIVLLTYYGFNYTDPNSGPELAAFVGLNSIASGIATGFGGKVADGFNAFFVASLPYGGDACAAGLLIQLPGGGCDVHPSAKGQKVLANAVTKVYEKD